MFFIELYCIVDLVGFSINSADVHYNREVQKRPDGTSRNQN